MAVTLTADLIEAFSLSYLQRGFDNPKPIPNMHREAWQLYCSGVEQAAVAAPRGHAKSSALTHTFTLASLLFRVDDYAIVVSATEELAIEYLGDIARELTENEDLITDFGLKGFVTQSKTELVLEFKDGEQFRVLARGSGQKMRGRKWRGKRPGLIICDDLEDDEQVESIDRRQKFRRWFFRAVKPALRRGGKLRIHGTILHDDSLLARLMKDKSWNTLFYKAHESFDDFSNILWPEQFSEADLRAIRQSFIEQFDASGYSQEYLNDPFDNNEAFLRKEDFIPMAEEDFAKEKRCAIGVDFAISKKDKANRTSMTVGGQCADNLLHVVHQVTGRWDTIEIIDNMFELEEIHCPEVWFVEDGVIWKAIEPMLKAEMLKRGVFLHLSPVLPLRDKATRGRSFQKRMRAGACRFNTRAPWYVGYQAELLRFTGYSDAVLDDQFDSSAILSRGIDSLSVPEETDFMDDDELYFSGHGKPEGSGRSIHTGY